MGVDSKHPRYTWREPDWREARDAYEGERVVKERGFEYLPPTISMQLDGLKVCGMPLTATQEVAEESEGWVSYWMYRHRAEFPGAFTQCVNHHLGLLWQHAPTYKLPEQMQYLLKTATKDKQQPLNHVLRRMHKQILTTGHATFVADINGKTFDPAPFYLSVYDAEDKTNWNIDPDSKKLDLVVFREVYDKIDADYNRKTIERYRLFELKDSVVSVSEYERPGEYPSNASAVTIIGTQVAPSMDVQGGVGFKPTRSKIQLEFKGTPLDELPVVCVNASELSPDPGVPPRQHVVRACIKYYRNDADYQQNLYSSGQDTFVTIGENEPLATTPSARKKTRIGAGSKVSLALGGKAEFVGVSGVGLPEQRKCIESIAARLEAESGSLTNAGAGTRESGEALATKVGAKTATLHEIAITCAEALQTLLRKVARWMGLNPDEVEVIANTDFTDAQVDAGVILALWTMKKEGGPVQSEDLHNYLNERGFTAAAFKEVMAVLEADKKVIEDAAQEPPEKPLPGGGVNAARGAGANTRSKGSKPKQGKSST